METKKQRRIDQKRERGENWTGEEKEIFIELMKESASTIESKNTDTNTNKLKQEEWLKVQRRFQEITGKCRDIPQFKGFWRRTRMSAKKKIFKHKKALRATGGGVKPPSPSLEDLKVVEICPADFIEDDNCFDSDGIYQTQEINMKVERDSAANNLKYVVCTAGPSTKEDTTVIMDFVDIVQEADNSPDEDGVNDEVQLDSNKNPVQSDRGIQQKKTSNAVLHRPQMKESETTKKRLKAEISHKGTIVDSNIEIKQKTFHLIEEEYKLKLQYQKQELCHQQLKHKIEIDNLLLDKEIKQLQLKKLQKELLQ